MNGHIIRESIESDDRFIRSTWAKGLYFGNKALKQFPKSLIDPIVFNEIDLILSKKDTQILVASLVDDEEVALGYCIFQNDLLYWLYVKPAWQKLGLAKALCPKEIKQYRFSSDLGRVLIHKKQYQLKEFYENQVSTFKRIHYDTGHNSISKPFDGIESQGNQDES